MSRSEFFSDRSNVDYMKVGDVRGGMILTVSDFFVNTSSLGRKPCLRFTETGEKVLTLNETNYDFFMGQWGEDEYSWIGKRVAVSIQQGRDPNVKGGIGPVIRFAKVPEQKAAASE